MREVFARDQPAAARHLSHDEVRDTAGVERRRAAVGDQLQRAGELGLHEAGSGRRCGSVHQELRPRSGEPAEPLGFAFDHVAARAVEHVAVACQRDSGHEQLLPGEPAEFSVRLVHPGDRSGNSDRAMARERRADRITCRVDVHVPRRPRGGGLAKVERADRAVLHPGDHEPASPDVARHGVDDRQRERHRHRGVDRVAAPAQDVHADVTTMA